jgi:uncharacterized membrane protein YbaN (DUF454 family)
MNQAQALLWSLAVEVPIVVAFGRGSPRLRLAGVALAATLLTHPFCIAALRSLEGAMSYPARVALVEWLVVLVEALLFWRFADMPPRRALLVAVLANAASYFSGLLLRTYVG